MPKRWATTERDSPHCLGCGDRTLWKYGEELDSTGCLEDKFRKSHKRAEGLQEIKTHACRWKTVECTAFIPVLSRSNRDVQNKPRLFLST